MTTHKITILASIGLLMGLLATSAHAAAKPTPQECVSLLKAGNARFVAGTAEHPHTSAARLALAGQENQGDYAYATVITCSDSRVPVERIFDAGIMDIFTIRVAGNVLDVDEVGSVEYGISHVRTPVFVILGHTQCGAVTAVTHAIEGTAHALERNIPPLVDNIEPAVRRAMSNHGNISGDAIIPYAIEENVYQGAKDLFMQSPTARNMVNSGSLKVIGAIYDVSSGRINWLPEDKIMQVLAGVEANPERAMNAMAGSGHGASHAAADAHQTSAQDEAAVASVIAKLEKHKSTSDQFSAKEIVGAGLKKLLLPLFLALTIAFCIGIIFYFARTKNGRGEVHLRKTLGARLVTAFGFLIVITAAMCVYSLTSMKNIGLQIELIADEFVPATTAATAIASSQLHQSIILERATRFSEMSGSTAKEQFEDSVTEFQQINDKVDNLAAEALKFLAEIPARSEEDVSRIEQTGSTLSSISGRHHEFARLAEAAIGLAREKKYTQARLMEEHLATSEENLNQEIEALLANLDELTTDSTRAASRQEARAASILFITATVAVLFGLLIAVMLTLSITGPINKVIASMQSGSDEVAGASEQVSMASQQLAEGASEQASGLEETAASLEMMSAGATQSAENSKLAEHQSQEVRTNAETGLAAMADLKSAMEMIKTSSDETAKVVKTIDDLAFQTNLLALNAAVEAARAGDAGKGFAVVAEEVRNLAQRSAAAAQGTSDLIDGAKQNSDRGVAATAEAATVLEQIVEGVVEVSSLIEKLSGAGDEQARSVSEINTAVGQMDSVTQANAASAEESAAAAEEMSAQAGELKSLVQDLVRIVEGAARDETTPASSNSKRGQIGGRTTGASQASRHLTSPSSTRPQGERTPNDVVIPLDEDCLIEL